jgi:hypothetical protein
MQLRKPNAEPPAQNKTLRRAYVKRPDFQSSETINKIKDKASGTTKIGKANTQCKTFCKSIMSVRGTLASDDIGSGCQTPV